MAEKKNVNLEELQLVFLPPKGEATYYDYMISGDELEAARKHFSSDKFKKLSQKISSESLISCITTKSL